ncbi:hypothetical protein F4774DRAFT_398554 [Daldinia eschscholtzii]|nr:hypothetical protein F4774DRAFT_398554 [Daldinia eschscholtzii]
MASSLAEFGDQYMPSTGGCMVDLAAIPSHLFDSCSTVHIRIPEVQHHVDVQSNMICIKPSQPAPAPNAAIYREQYMYPNVVVPTDIPHASPKAHKQQPPSFDTPGNPKGSAPNHIPKPHDSKPMSPNAPGDSPKEPLPSPRTFVKTTHWSTLTATHTAFPSPHVTHVLQSTVVATTSCTTRLHGFSTSTIVQPSTLTTRIILSSVPTPPPQDLPTPSPQPSHPAVVPPLFPLPEPEPIPEEPEVRPVPIPEPEVDGPAPPTPEYCGEMYFKMDVTHIETLDPHDLDTYLNLLGLGNLGLDLDLDLDHGVNGLVDSLLNGAVDDDSTRVVWRELERLYRVKCGVSVQELWSSEEGGFVRSMGSQTECLQECEKSAIGKAGDGEVVECLGAAWNERLERDNCRFWMGGRDEFLPVERLRAGETGEWDLVYL